MDSGEILREIKSMHTEELDADTLVEILAFTLASMQSSISPADLRRLITLSAAAYRIGKKASTEAQIDTATPLASEEVHSKPTLH